MRNTLNLLQKTNRMYALISKISKNKETIDALLEKSKILENESRLDKYLCYVLVTELMFGAKKLNGESKPVLCVGSYEDRFNEILAEIQSGDKSEATENDGKCHESAELNSNKIILILYPNISSKTSVYSNQHEQYVTIGST